MMRISDIEQFSNYIFDCDGVLLDSNAVKTRAFYNVASAFGEDVAQEFVEYHKRNGGVSRYRKINYLFGRLLNRSGSIDREVRAALSQYAEEVRKGLLECSLVPGVSEFLQSLPAESRRFVVSGGDEDEVRWALHQRGLAEYFDAIYGSPRQKSDIVTSLKAGGMLSDRGLYFGDAWYDYEVAHAHGMEFCFVSGYSDYSDWKHELPINEISVIEDFQCLFSSHLGR